ncbi:MAG: hypothetical protein AAGJ83_00695, partial [Planctomycetota bacterium]
MKPSFSRSAARKRMLGLTVLLVVASLMCVGCDAAREDVAKTARSRAVSDPPVAPDPPLPTHQAISDWISRGEWSKAESALRRKLIEEPDAISVNLLISQVYAATDRIDEAVETLELLKEIHSSKRDEIEVYLVNLLTKSGRRLAAIRRLRSLSDERPQLTQLRRELIQLCEDVGLYAEANCHCRLLMRSEVLSFEQLVGLS